MATTGMARRAETINLVRSAPVSSSVGVTVGSTTVAA
jgi:hypothetical protein